MRIDFLVNTNEYDVIRWFAKGLAKALKNQEVSIRFLSLDYDERYLIVSKIQEDPPDCTCSFSDVSFNNKTPISELLQLPHFSLSIDPVIYFLHQLKSSYSFISYVDQHDGKLFDEVGFNNHFFLPHGGDTEFFKDPEDFRPYQAVFFGSCIDYECVEREWLSKYGSLIVKALSATCDKVLSSSMDSLLFLLLESLKENQIDPNTICIPLLHHEVDLYIRGKDRIELLKALST